jgi:hypothetical protein
VERSGASAIDTHSREVSVNKVFGLRKQVSEALNRGLKRPSKGMHQSSDYRCRVNRCQLLAKNGVHGEFKGVPHSGNPQAAVTVQKRFQPLITRQVIGDAKRVGSEIEKAPHTLDNLHQELVSGQFDAHQ